MNYRHIYHAGNFSDVFKHVIIIMLLEKLLEKEAAFCVLDSHAGIGLYDLRTEKAQKTGEYKNGIEKIIQSQDKLNVIEKYVSIVKLVNDEQSNIKFYPGSPFICCHMLREKDQLILSELHTEDVKILKKNFKHDKRVAVHFCDGYQAIKAFLPPKERRGLVLIDPPYDRKDRETEDYKKVITALVDGYSKFRDGIFVIWYPIKDRWTVRKFHSQIQDTKIPKIMAAEMLLDDGKNSGQLNGSGMIIVNPPWQFEKRLNVVIPQLLDVLKQNNSGRYNLTWLTKEVSDK